MLDGSAVGEINALAIMQAGEHFISAGEDKVVKLWDYDEGISYYQGIGHSGHVTKIAVAPNQKFIVSCGSEGGIFLWTTPAKVLGTLADDDMPENIGEAIDTMNTGGPKPVGAAAQ